MSSIFFNHSATKLDINNQGGKKTIKNTNTWRLNNMFLNSQQVTEVIKRDIKKFLETNDNKNTIAQNLCSKNSSKREVYSNIILPQETRKTLNRQPNSTAKTTRRTTTTTATTAKTKLVGGK